MITITLYGISARKTAFILLLALWQTAYSLKAAEVTLRGMAAESPPRTVFVRGESVRVVWQPEAQNSGRAALRGQALRGQVRLLDSEGTLCVERRFRLKRDAQVSGTGEAVIATAPWRVGEYQLDIATEWGGATVQTQRALSICAPPDHSGFVFGMLHEQRRQGNVLMKQLDELQAMGFSSAMHYQPDSAFMEAVLRKGMDGMALLHSEGNRRAYRNSNLRMNASGKPFGYRPDKPGSGLWGISHPDWQAETARGMENTVRRWAGYPGFRPVIHTSDDFYRWTGLDYNTNNTVAFESEYGIPVPRPPEVYEQDYPMTVDHPKGVMPDDEPWVLWQRFNSCEVLGRFNGLLTEAVQRGSGDPSAMIGPVCGGGPYTLGTIPLVDLASGQWPPYNFGPGHFNLISYYNYNAYWFPALAQVWWAELARMGNRSLPVWVMPDTMDRRRTYHLQNLWMFLAGGVDGIVYFLYEWTSPGSREALERIGPQLAPVRGLLSELKPVPRRIGLLMPFETACFRTDHPADSAYAFGNLLMAHADVEPVWPEELPERGGQYRAVLLHDVDWLIESNRQRLETYRLNGGRVIADAATEVDWPGLERLDFALGKPLRDGGYGNTGLMHRIKAFTSELAEPWADSDDPHLLLRHYRIDNIDYLWVVHLMDQAEDRLHIHETHGQEFKVDPLPAYADADHRNYTARVRIPSGGVRRVADIIGRHPVPVWSPDASKERLEIELEVPYWQGRLLAFYPENPESVVLRLSKVTGRGRRLRLQIDICAANGRPVPMTLPLEMEFMRPDGQRCPEWSRPVVARKGSIRIVLDVARNAYAGEWAIKVRELSTGISGQTRFLVE